MTVSRTRMRLYALLGVLLAALQWGLWLGRTRSQGPSALLGPLLVTAFAVTMLYQYFKLRARP